jgi:hypothetical protein
MQSRHSRRRPSGGANDWWYVANGSGFNCLTFSDAPGKTFTSEQKAKEIAESFNKSGEVKMSHFWK